MDDVLLIDGIAARTLSKLSPREVVHLNRFLRGEKLLKQANSGEDIVEGIAAEADCGCGLNPLVFSYHFTPVALLVDSSQATNVGGSIDDMLSATFNRVIRTLCNAEVNQLNIELREAIAAPGCKKVCCILPVPSTTTSSAVEMQNFSCLINEITSVARVHRAATTVKDDQVLVSILISTPDSWASAALRSAVTTAVGESTVVEEFRTSPAGDSIVPCFLYEAIATFPVILPRAALRQLQSAWAGTQRLSDVAMLFHSFVSTYLYLARYREEDEEAKGGVGSKRKRRDEAENGGTQTNGILTIDQLDDQLQVQKEQIPSETVGPPNVIARSIHSINKRSSYYHPGTYSTANVVFIEAFLEHAQSVGKGDFIREAMAFFGLYEALCLQQWDKLATVTLKERRVNNGGNGMYVADAKESLATLIKHHKRGLKICDYPHMETMLPQEAEAATATVDENHNDHPQSAAKRGAKGGASEKERIPCDKYFPVVTSAHVSIAEEVLNRLTARMLNPVQSMDALTKAQQQQQGGGGGSSCDVGSPLNFFSAQVTDAARIIYVARDASQTSASAAGTWLSFTDLTKLCCFGSEHRFNCALKELRQSKLVVVNLAKRQLRCVRAY